MKKFLFLVLASVLIFIVSCSKNVMPTASDNSATVSALSTGWHQLTQLQRNAAIVAAVTNNWYNGQLYTGLGQCKGWVQTVVSQASSGLACLPANQVPPAYPVGNEYKWSTSDTCYQYVNWLTQNACIPIEYSQPGWIVQMYFKTLSTGHVDPHTMIIMRVDGTGIYISDCNRSVANAVAINYYMLFTYFYAHVSDYYGNINRNYYNLYSVL